ncbi:MAG: hypothetical protein R2771_03230 [Saprospiraceae bacterium]
MLKKVYIGLFIVIAGIFLFYMWAMIGFGGGRSMEGEIHYIPNGFTGYINIVFDQKDGLKKEYLRGKRLYRIPKSGDIEDTIFRKYRLDKGSLQ